MKNRLSLRELVTKFELNIKETDDTINQITGKRMYLNKFD